MLWPAVYEYFLHHRNTLIFVTSQDSISCRATCHFEPNQLFQSCSHFLMGLEDECLFALRSSCPQNIKPTFQLSDKMAVFHFAFWPLPSPSWNIWRPEKKKKKPSIAFFFAAVRWYTGSWAPHERWADAASWWMQGSYSVPLLLQGFNSHRNQTLRKGAWCLFVWKRGTKQDKNINKVY